MSHKRKSSETTAVTQAQATEKKIKVAIPLEKQNKLQNEFVQVISEVALPVIDVARIVVMLTPVKICWGAINSYECEEHGVDQCHDCGKFHCSAHTVACDLCCGHHSVDKCIWRCGGLSCNVCTHCTCTDCRNCAQHCICDDEDLPWCDECQVWYCSRHDYATVDNILI